jgi:hypothetical protein
MQYKSLSIDLDTAVHLVNVHYSAYLEKDPEGIYWSGSHEPLLVRGDLYRYFHYDKTLGEVPYDLSQGLPTKAVYAEVNAQPRVMVPQCLVQKKGLLSTQAIIPNVATCVVLAVIGDYIRHSVNSPYRQQEDFNLYQFMVDDEALAELALAQSGVFGINHDSAVNLLNRDGITLNDLGIAVGDEVGKHIHRSCQSVIAQIGEFIGPHVDMLYETRIVGTVLTITQGLDYRASLWLRQQEQDRLNKDHAPE